ncbi:MAG: metalloregulator ArsR/SmtB family transcription factor [Verrucomicrobiales bacterium]
MFKMFSEPTRLAIFQVLDQRGTEREPACRIARHFASNVSRQLKILAEAGLLTRRKEGIQVFYSIRDKMVFSMCDLVCEKLNRDAIQRADTVSFSV